MCVLQSTEFTQLVFKTIIYTLSSGCHLYCDFSGGYSSVHLKFLMVSSAVQWHHTTKTKSYILNL